jgi:hypothetical protein
MEIVGCSSFQISHLSVVETDCIQSIHRMPCMLSILVLFTFSRNYRKYPNILQVEKNLRNLIISQKQKHIPLRMSVVRRVDG